jgi:hypothetical protein
MVPGEAGTLRMCDAIALAVCETDSTTVMGRFPRRLLRIYQPCPVVTF